MSRSPKSITPADRTQHRAVLVGTSVQIAAGLLVIWGWVFRIPALRGEALGTFVAPLTALCFVVVAVSVLLQHLPHRALRFVGQLVGVAVAVFAAATLYEHLAHTDLGIDRWFLASRLDDWFLRYPPVGRMAAPTAFALMLVGAALVFLRARRSAIVDVCAATVLMVGYLAVVGFLYGIRPLYGYVMAWPTAVMIVISAVTLCAAASDSTVWRLFTANDAGGITFRRLGFLIATLLPLLGRAGLWLERAGWVTREVGLAILIVTAVLIFLTAAFRTSLHLNRLDYERKQAYAALVRSEKLAAAGKLAATIAHEVNNPLEAALNLLYLANSATSFDAAKPWLKDAERELLRVSAIARQSLGFYRSSSKPDLVSINAVLREVIEFFAPRAAAKQIELRLTDSLNATVHGDAGELRQVLSNLISNAIDACGVGCQVSVFVQAGAKGMVEIVVADNGTGIATDDHASIFEPFFTTKEAVGTGLGLFVVKELVQKHNGRVTFESRTEGESRGTIFTIALPVTPAAHDTTPHAGAAAQ